METNESAAVTAELKAFVAAVGGALRSDTQREAFARYVVGLESDLPSKTIESIAAQSNPTAPSAEHQALHYFLADAPWNDHAVRRASARWSLQHLHPGSPVRATVLDDTPFRHRGPHLVGLAPQWDGSLKRTTPCQAVVTLAAVTDHEALLYDLALFLPESWAFDTVRRLAAKIPDDLLFQPKWDIALDLLRTAKHDGLELGEAVLADAGYGHSEGFRRGITEELGLPYGVGVQSDQRACFGTRTRKVAEWARRLSPRKFRRVSWQEGTHGRLSARFSVRRVRVSDDPKLAHAKGPEVWLVAEWRDGEAQPTDFYLSTLPARWSRRRLVRALKRRWPTEQMNRDLKQELGVDHYQGRSWPGWCHHASVAVAAYALLVSSRRQAFPPSTASAPHRAATRPSARPQRRAA
jgi:SRSO17 transposase